MDLDNLALSQDSKFISRLDGGTMTSRKLRLITEEKPMAPRIIHFGRDNCYRVDVLRSAGYEVVESASMADLAAGLQSGGLVDALVFSEDNELIAEEAIELVHRTTQAPVILFWRSHDGHAGIDEHKFEKVYASFTPPSDWLAETALLIAQSRALR